MALIRTIESQHGELFGSLERLEALVQTRASRDEILSGVDEVRRNLLAHQRAAERFVVVPLREQRLLDTAQVAALRAELDDLAGEAVRLMDQHPRRQAVLAFVEATRAHIERQARVVVPVARGALDAGRLPATPAWCVQEVYGESTWPEQWLG